MYADGVDLTEKIPLANGHVSVAIFIKNVIKKCSMLLQLKRTLFSNGDKIWNAVLYAYVIPRSKMKQHFTSLLDQLIERPSI